MRNADFHDMFTVRKGPEDGSEFPITATPILIGKGPSCLVQVQFDVTVRSVHARATAAKGGYRIRSAEGAPVYVDGRRVGMIRSRMLLPKGVLKVGYTELVLSCADVGLASSAKARWSDGDAAWVLRSLGIKLLVLGHMVRNFLWSVLRLTLRHWILALVLIALACYLFGPSMEGRVTDRVVKALKELLDF